MEARVGCWCCWVPLSFLGRPFLRSGPLPLPVVKQMRKPSSPSWRAWTHLSAHTAPSRPQAGLITPPDRAQAGHRRRQTPRYIKLHTGKLPGIIFHELCCRGLAKELKGPESETWWQVEATTATAYMAYLACAISGARPEMLPVTDEEQVVGTLAEDSGGLKVSLLDCDTPRSPRRCPRRECPYLWRS